MTDEYVLKVFEEIKEHCDKYNLRCKLIFDEIHIYTLFEEFYFVPIEGHKTKLMHKNQIMYGNRKGPEYHEQFRWWITPEGIVDFIRRHSNYKYVPKKKAK